MEFKGFGGNKLKDFKQIIAKQISKTIDINEEELESYIETPKDNKNGDYAFPCFRLAKELRKAPPAIANEIKEKIEAVEEIEKIEITYKEKESANTADSIIANNIIDGKLVDHA